MKVVTFGEIMLRLKTPENLRIMQSDVLRRVMVVQKPMLL